MLHNTLRRLKRDDAISPVIGTILMIAATVIIAGAVYAAVNAYSARSAKAPTDASWKAQAIDNGTSTQQIRIAYLAGDQDAAATVLVKNAAGATVSAINVAPPSAWDPGDFAVYMPTTPGTYYVTVVMGSATVLDSTLDVN